MYVGLAVQLLLIAASVEIISWIGKEIIIDCISSGFFFLTNPNASKKERALKADILKTKAELAATSSQDEFAKWARLRRKVDKGIAELEQMSSGNRQKPGAAYLKAALFLLTTVLPFFFTAWNKKQPVFFLPPHWFGPLERWLGFPSAPLGAVSCGVWTMACKRTMNVVKNIIVDLRTPIEAAEVQEKVPVPAGKVSEKTAAAEEKASAPSRSEKVPEKATATAQ